MRQTYGELWQEWLKLMDIQPQSPYEMIEQKDEQIAILQDLLRQSRLNEARLLALLDTQERAA